MVVPLQSGTKILALSFGTLPLNFNVFWGPKCLRLLNLNWTDSSLDPIRFASNSMSAAIIHADALSSKVCCGAHVLWCRGCCCWWIWPAAAPRDLSSSYLESVRHWWHCWGTWSVSGIHPIYSTRHLDLRVGPKIDGAQVNVQFLSSTNSLQTD